MIFPCVQFFGNMNPHTMSAERNILSMLPMGFVFSRKRIGGTGLCNLFLNAHITDVNCFCGR